jgi:hypothetical protein
MPKIKPPIEEYIKNFPELKFENNKIFCRVCIKTVSLPYKNLFQQEIVTWALLLQINCEKKHNIIQHTKTAGHHERLKKLSSQNIRQQTIKESIATSSSDEQKTFYSDLCNAMISSNILLTGAASPGRQGRQCLTKYFTNQNLF